MGAVKFLTTLGRVLLQGTAIFAGFAPLAESAFPQQAGAIRIITKDLTQLADIIVQVEHAGQKLGMPGEQKLQMAAALFAPIILQSAMFSGRTIGDPALFQQGTEKLASGLADVLNSLHGNPEVLNKLAIG